MLRRNRRSLLLQTFNLRPINQSGINQFHHLLTHINLTAGQLALFEFKSFTNAKLLAALLLANQSKITSKSCFTFQTWRFYSAQLQGWKNIRLLYYNQTHGSLLAELWWVICRSQVLLECGYSPPKIWKLLPEWSQDLITGSCFPQIAFSPTLIEHDCSETQNDSVIVAYRPAYKPALWPEFCENVSVWTVCVDQPVPDRSALSLPP